MSASRTSDSNSNSPHVCPCRASWRVSERPFRALAQPACIGRPSQRSGPSIHPAPALPPNPPPAVPSDAWRSGLAVLRLAADDAAALPPVRAAFLRVAAANPGVPLIMYSQVRRGEGGRWQGKWGGAVRVGRHCLLVGAQGDKEGPLAAHAGGRCVCGVGTRPHPASPVLPLPPPSPLPVLPAAHGLGLGAARAGGRRHLPARTLQGRTGAAALRAGRDQPAASGHQGPGR